MRQAWRLANERETDEVPAGVPRMNDHYRFEIERAFCGWRRWLVVRVDTREKPLRAQIVRKCWTYDGALFYAVHGARIARRPVPRRRSFRK